MALSATARRKLQHGLKSMDIGTEFADVVDAGSGTLSTHAGDRIRTMVANRAAGDGIVTAVDAGTALSDYEKQHLATLLGDQVVMGEIAAALAL